ncbi:sigma-70 family RNA polymerase sigma factor [Pseudomonas abyssi]|uniref:RNA polymerase subunit sigma n=1 Tax=Pseudomonas abyssi TaxID=170540 RepID=A0A395RA84_9PSED|nr:sigma-70 family RNA polymerase sigma factor [Halopseudomonas gallaeciensis]RGP57028.1 RNA polymerase subunit sigma [Halopseudomonas gallaeciensis]
MPETSPTHSVESLYNHHHGWLHNWLRQRLGCPQQAADLAQDTFVRVLMRREPVTGTAARSLLSTIARGLLVDHWRRSALERAWLEAMAQLPEAYAPSPQEQQETLQTLEQIARMLEGLRSPVRQAFMLHQLGGLTHAQIAERLGVSSRTVERHVATALLHCYQLRYGAV